MRIAFLALRNSIHTTRWVNSLAERGHEIHLISMQEARFPINPMVIQHDLRIPPPAGYYLNVGQVRHILSQFPPDILHAHYASGYGTLGRLARWKPLILSVWGSDVFEFPYRSRWSRRTAFANLSAAGTICSTSHVMAAQVIKLVPAVKEHLHVIPFGIDCSTFSPDSTEKDNRYITIGTIKSLGLSYGIDILLRAFTLAVNSLKNSQPAVAEVLKLVIVGGAPPFAAHDQTEFLKKLSIELGIQDHVRFVGPVDHKEVPRWLNSFDIYSTLSRSESFGVAVLEASACALPVVVSSVGGLPEVVQSDRTGFIVPPEDPEKAAQALLKLVTNVSLRKSMGQAGLQFVLQNYEWGKCVTAMEQIYTQVKGRI